MSVSGQAEGSAHTSTFGMNPRLSKSSTDGSSKSFWYRSSGNIGQEILEGDGVVVAWTTDLELAQRSCKLLNESEGLLN